MRDRSLRLGQFRATARDILSRDREARRHRVSVDTSGAIARALERAYKDGLEDGQGSPQAASLSVERPLQWVEIPRRAAELLEAALPSASYDRADNTLTLDLDREDGVFVPCGVGSPTRYRVARSGPRWGDRVYVADYTYSDRFFSILLRMGLVEPVRRDGVGTRLVPTTVAIDSYVEEIRRQAKEYGYHFVLIRSEAEEPSGA